MRKKETLESLEKTIIDCEYRLANLSKLDPFYSVHLSTLRSAKMRRIFLLKRENERV